MFYQFLSFFTHITTIFTLLRLWDTRDIFISLVPSNIYILEGFVFLLASLNIMSRHDISNLKRHHDCFPFEKQTSDIYFVVPDVILKSFLTLK